MSKKESLLNFAFGLFCTLAFAVSVPFLLYYAFGLKADPAVLIACSLLFGAGFSAAFGSGRTYLALVVVALGVLALIWTPVATMESFILFLKTISDGILKSFESFSHLESKLRISESASCNQMLGIISAATGAFAAIALFSKNRSRYGIELLPLELLSGAAVILAMVQNVAVVPAWPVLLFSAGLLSILISRSSQRRGRGFWQWLAVPTSAFVIICYLLTSPANQQLTLVTQSASGLESFFYTYSPIKATDDGMRFVMPWISQSLGNTAWNKSLKKADLTRVGPVTSKDGQVMSVVSNMSACFYLRGTSYGVYTGNSWEAIDSSLYDGLDLDENLFLSQGQAWVDGEAATLTVRTNRNCNTIYAPSSAATLPDQVTSYLDLYVENPALLSEYSMIIAPSDSLGNGEKYPTAEGYEDFVHENYLQLPQSTALFLKEYYQAPVDASPKEILSSISALLREEKKYNTKTKRMTRGKGDFVTWFLSESDTGYCIHFASAAVMMLRSSGIPARLVTGYVAETVSGQWITVCQGDAHSWVEYYVDGQGWYAFDPTPSPSAEGASAADAYIGEVGMASLSYSQEKETNDAPKADAAERHREKKERKSLSTGLILATVFALYGVWYLGLRLLRFVQFRSKDLNRRTLYIYRWIVLLSRVDGVLPPKRAENLALKARFSREGVSPGDAAEILAIYGDIRERMGIFSESLRAFVANFFLAI